MNTLTGQAAWQLPSFLSKRAKAAVTPSEADNYWARLIFIAHSNTINLGNRLREHSHDDDADFHCVTPSALSIVPTATE